MPTPVACPACQQDGTEEANRIIARKLNGKTAQPPKVRPLSEIPPQPATPASLAPHLVASLRDAVVQELAGQRRELIAGQQMATAELTDLARRLASVQAPLLERLRAYEQRIAELEAELSQQTQENRELLKLKIEQLREQVAVGRTRNRVNFN